MYFRIRMMNTNQDSDYDGMISGIVEAESITEAREKVLRSRSNGGWLEMDERAEDMEVHIEEMTEKQCIKMEKDYLRQEILRLYNIRHYDIENLPVREYQKIAIRNNTEKIYLEALKEFNKYCRIERRLHRLANVDAMPVYEFKKYMNLLLDAETEEEYNAIIEEIKNK